MLRQIGAALPKSRVQVSLSANHTYFIVIGSNDWTNPGGDLHFYAGPVAPPANDDITTPAAVGALPFTYAENTLGATTSPGDPTPSCTQGDQSVWFAYDATYDGYLELNTYGSSYATVFAVYTGSSGTLTEVGC